MKKNFLLLLFSLWLMASIQASAQDTTQQIIPGRMNGTAQEEKSYVILISIDGFRYDYMQLHGARHLQQLSSSGIAAEAMYPSFPSITFPNHYTIITGLYPSHHGLVGNTIYDPATGKRYSMGNSKAVLDPFWYGGTPLWVLAEKQQLLSASFYWPGSETPIQGTLPSYYYHYNEKIPIARRIQTVVDWLSLPKEKRPHFITFYFPEVDHAGHLYGPESEETRKAVQFVDSSVYALNEAVQKTQLPVNFVVVSDHGMISLNETPLVLPFKVDTTTEEVSSNGTVVDIFLKDKKRQKQLYTEIKAKQEHFQVYLKQDVPLRYQYGAKDDYHHKIGDIILIAESPYYFSNKKKNIAASHGFYAYDIPEMKAIFLAWGSSFQNSKRIPAFENTEVYPLIATLLGLKFDYKNIDGKGILIKETMKENQQPMEK